MIFVIGGACQGKREFARNLLGVTWEEWEQKVADGEKDSLQLAWETPFLVSFHQWVRQVMERGESLDGFVGKVLEAGPELVIMDEVGYGIVPVEQKEREYREAVGRAGQMLAAKGERVYRVVCGIPMRLK